MVAVNAVGDGMKCRKRQMVAIALIVKMRVIEERIVPNASIWIGEAALRDLLEVLGDALDIIDVGGKTRKILEQPVVQP
jgi:hypothetical protein